MSKLVCACENCMYNRSFIFKGNKRMGQATEKPCLGGDKTVRVVSRYAGYDRQDLLSDPEFFTKIDWTGLE